MSFFLQIGCDGVIVIVCMNYFEICNVLILLEQIQEFVDFCVELCCDLLVWVMVLIGNGSVFCVGGNVKDMCSCEGIFVGLFFELCNIYCDGIQCILLVLYELDILVIVVVNGLVIGVGLDLVCMCDICLVFSLVLFVESFVCLGIVFGDGGVWLLLCIIGIFKVSLMVFIGDMIDVVKVLEWGLVEQVCIYEILQFEVQFLVQCIVSNLGYVLCLCKCFLCEGQYMCFDLLFELFVVYQFLVYYIEDYQEVVVVFMDKCKLDYLDC